MASIFSLFLVLSLSFSACIAAPAPTPAKAVGPSKSLLAACKQTPLPDLCVKYLSVFPESQATDIHGLTGLSVRAAAKYLKEAADKVFEDQNDKSANSNLEQCLDDCSETIEDAIEQLDDTTTAVDVRAFDDIKAWVSAAIADASTCEESCKGSNGKQKLKSLAEITDTFKKLCKVTLALAKLDAKQ
ncbi:hypothetical protein LUZ60_011237 [Juncus effusus]|nr:hypothetical protein LUZ60_011237 [Juncus effusus]